MARIDCGAVGVRHDDDRRPLDQFAAGDASAGNDAAAAPFERYDAKRDALRAIDAHER